MIDRILGLRAVVVAPALIALVVTAASLLSLQDKLTDIRSGERPKPEWMATQLEFEFLRLDRALEQFRTGNATPRQIMLRFDILWSRIELMRSGTTRDVMNAYQVDISVLDRLLAVMAVQERRIATLQPGDAAAAGTVLRAMAPLEAPIHDLSLNSLAASSDEATSIRDRLLSMSHTTNLLSLGTAAALILLVAMLWIEANRHRRVSEENARLLVASRAAADAKTQFVSVVNHELRTPLTSISGAIGLLKGGVGGNLPKPATDMIQIAHENCERLKLLINDLLDLDKVEAGKMRMQVDPVDLSALARQSIRANEGYATRLGVTLDGAGIEPGVVVAGDGERLMQVMANLLSNAAKFSHKGGRVEVSVRAEGRTAVVAVRDHGIGIPESARDRIFEKFQQVDSSDHRLRGGTGLGLSIALAIVRAHGGEIGVISTEGEGTTFEVRVTRMEEPTDAKGEPLPPSILAGSAVA